jgi:hypothetical protein
LAEAPKPINSLATKFQALNDSWLPQRFSGARALLGPLAAMNAAVCMHNAVIWRFVAVERYLTGPLPTSLKIIFREENN